MARKRLFKIARGIMKRGMKNPSSGISKMKRIKWGNVAREAGKEIGKEIVGSGVVSGSILYGASRIDKRRNKKRKRGK